MKLYPIATFIAVIFITSACSTTGHVVDGAFEKQWESDVSVEDHATIDVAQNGQYVLISPDPQDKNVEVYEGAGGSRIWRERESLGSRLLGSIQVEGVSASDFQPDMYEYVILEEEGVALFFDYTLRSDKIRARDINNGELLWEIEGYSWSPSKVGDLLSAAARVGAANTTSGNSLMYSAGDIIGRGTMVENLVLPLPGQNAFLLKYRDGLICFDSETGSVLWETEDFEGGGLAMVLDSQDGDIIVISKLVNSFRDLTNDHHIAKINPENGDVKWISSYDAGRRVLDMPVSTTAMLINEKLVVHAIDTQIFDINSGDVVAGHRSWASPEGNRLLIAGDNALFSIGYPLREDPPAFGVYTGHLPTYLRRFDMETGEPAWDSEETRSTIHSITSTPDMLLLSASGDLMDGETGLVAVNSNTGDMLWNSSPFDQTRMLEGFSLREHLPRVPVTNTITDDDKLYTAGPKKLYYLEKSTGEEILSVDHEVQEIGFIHSIFDNFESIGVISEKGAALYDKNDGSLLYKTPENHVTNYYFAGDNLVLWHNDEMTIVNLERNETTGTVVLKDLRGNYFGNLRDGLYVTDDGRTLYVLDRKNKLTRYSVGQ